MTMIDGRRKIKKMAFIVIAAIVILSVIGWFVCNIFLFFPRQYTFDYPALFYVRKLPGTFSQTINDDPAFGYIIRTRLTEEELIIKKIEKWIEKKIWTLFLPYPAHLKVIIPQSSRFSLIVQNKYVFLNVDCPFLGGGKCCYSCPNDDELRGYIKELEEKYSAAPISFP
jgi:hypothetical protein